ncbi:MAG: hypothetical protein LBV27_01065 [Oscillospiraceae bacterium]|jgi:hypothetical protein|nr:hypothetical protein [Oscillospiraceae bacterium]
MDKRSGGAIKLITNLIFVLSGVYILIKGLYYNQFGMAVLGPVTFLFLLIPPVGQKLLRIELDWRFHVLIVLFCFLAFSLGTALDWYERFPFFNFFVHGLSGVLFTMVGYCIYGLIKKQGIARIKSDWLLQLAFAFCFSMMIAVMWEIGEFAGYLITGHDSQHTETTGVFDTMYDIIACVLGSILMTIDYALYSKKGWRSFFIKTLEQFYKLNMR